jgi:hypothetical protein
VKLKKKFAAKPSEKNTDTKATRSSPGRLAENNLERFFSIMWRLIPPFPPFKY